MSYAIFKSYIFPHFFHMFCSPQAEQFAGLEPPNQEQRARGRAGGFGLEELGVAVQQ